MTTLAPAFAAVEESLMAVVMVLPRLAAIFVVAPFLSRNILTGFVRAGLLVVLAVFVAPVAGDLPPMAPGLLLLVAAKEALIGLLLGLGFGLFVWAVQSAGDLIDFQTGSGNAAFFEPASGHDCGPTGGFLGWLVIALFVSGGGLLALIGVVVDSYRLWPVASFFPKLGPVLVDFAIRQGDTLFVWIVKLAAPVVLVLLLVELGMGLIGRVAPQLNVFQTAQPLKSLLAALTLLLFLPFVYESLQQFLLPSNGVLAFLRQVL